MTSPLIRVPKAHKVRVEQEGSHVKLVLDGRLVFDADWRYAREVGMALMARAEAARRVPP